MWIPLTPTLTIHLWGRSQPGETNIHQPVGVANAATRSIPLQWRGKMMILSLRIRFLCPKNPGLFLPSTMTWGWDFSTINPTRNREGSGFLGSQNSSWIWVLWVAMLVSGQFRVHRSFYRGELSSKGAGTTTKLSNSGFFVGRWYCCDGILVQNFRWLGEVRVRGGWDQKAELVREVVENWCIFVVWHVLWYLVC